MRLLIPVVVRWLLTMLMLPLCVAASRSVMMLVASIQPASVGLFPAAGWSLVGGFLLWLFIYYTLPRPVRTYVLAHELTHALWGALMGAAVSDLKVSRERGSVRLSKTNVLIVLAPYFFPLYTVLVMVAYYLMSVFLPVEKYVCYWLALVGLSWGFHFTFTLSTLAQHQTDIRAYGHAFSYAFIYLMNVLGIGLWVVMVSPATLEAFIALMGDSTSLALSALCALAARARELLVQ